MVLEILRILRSYLLLDMVSRMHVKERKRSRPSNAVFHILKMETNSPSTSSHSHATQELPFPQSKE